MSYVQNAAKNSQTPVMRLRNDALILLHQIVYEIVKYYRLIKFPAHY